MILAKHLSTSGQVTLIFGLICALLVALGLFLFLSLQSIERHNQQLQAQILQEWALSNELSRHLRQEQIEIYRHVQATETEDIQRHDQIIFDLKKANTQRWNDYEKLINNPAETQLYTKAMEAREKYWEESGSLLELSRANRDAEARDRAFSMQAPAYEEYQKAIIDIADQTAKEGGDLAIASTRVIVEIRRVGNSLIGLAILVTIGTGFLLIKLTRQLKEDNRILQTEMAARAQAEKDLRWKTALLEAQMHSSPDGIMVVNGQQQKIIQNQRLNEVWKIPPEMGDNPDLDKQIEWVTGISRYPAKFLEMVARLKSHPDEVCRGELEFEDGTVLDRYSAPVIGKGGEHFGRISVFRDITEARKATRQRDLMFALSPDMIFTAGYDGYLKQFNPAVERILGYSREELLAKPFLTFAHPDDQASVTETMNLTIKNGKMLGFEIRCSCKNGSYKWIQWNAVSVPEEQLFNGTGRDVTERKHIEARLLQSQKMETVGKLAGGVAHEFNSILTAIIGQSELLLSDLPEESPLVKNASEINKAAERAAVLTRQLLAYGRKQILQPQILDLNQVLTEMTGTVKHLMGREVEVQVVPARGLKRVKIDPGQMEQVIVNMTMNAADAMPNGGKLIMETSNVVLDENFVRPFAGLKAGGYVMLAITDTGIGMSDEVKARVFDPFFSTKAVGEGTGLGLATCYGILKQSEGHINVYSEIARGTTFKIYLPQVEMEAKASPPRSNAADLPRGTETILLAEDDPSLREMSATLLRRLGYTVLTATNGVEALSLKQQRDVGHIDLLFTDVVMPHMSGKELSDRIRAIYPHTKILFTSAYTENAIVHQGILNEGVILLPKPFTPSALANKIREVLDHPTTA